jgi:hypothetical protein
VIVRFHVDQEAVTLQANPSNPLMFDYLPDLVQTNPSQQTARDGPK